MTLDLSHVGRAQPAVEHAWDGTRALLYAVGVGAGQERIDSELAFTTENTGGVAQRVLPTFATLLGGRLPPELLADVPAGTYVHAEEDLTVHRPLPAAGRARTESEVIGIHDKGSGALVVTRSRITDAVDGAPLATLIRSTFLVGQGGFGGERGPRSSWAAPERAPDVEIAYRLPAGQPLVYRLSGDRNPLHSDPQVAREAGYPAPLVHGLCVYGYTGRALLHVLCDGDVARFGSMRGRFESPLPAGDERLEIAIWRDDDGGARFQTRDRAGRTVIGRGVFRGRTA